MLKCLFWWFLLVLFSEVGDTTTSALEGAREFEIVARLSGGRGTVAWQHAQLFRQSLDANDYDFVVNVTLKG